MRPPITAHSRASVNPEFKELGPRFRGDERTSVGNAVGAYGTKCDVAVADITGRSAASAIASPRPLAKQA